MNKIKKNNLKIINKNTKFKFSKNIKWGENVTFGPNCKTVEMGFGCFIGSNIYIDVEELLIGDYFTIHHGSVLHGKKCHIGHNNWIGHYTVLDSLGGLLKLGNNVGIGAHSQLWSHIKFGDRMAGCRWYGMDEIIVGDDVWFVGHCIVGAIKAEPRSMLLTGGVAVKDMRSNHVYGGSPAVDLTDKLGPQFKNTTKKKREEIFLKYLEGYEKKGNDTSFIKIVEKFENQNDSKYTQFNLLERKYVPRYTNDEFKFMRYLLYDKAKFTPITIDKR